MRIVLGVLAPDAGVVRWLGVPLTFKARRRIGYMPERGALSEDARCGAAGVSRQLHGMQGGKRGRQPSAGWNGLTWPNGATLSSRR